MLCFLTAPCAIYAISDKPICMFLIVGLGNPGAQYARTRHNIGWLVLDELARRYGITIDRKNCDARIGGGAFMDAAGATKVLLAKPQTFMNLSGKAVQALLRYYNIDRSKLIVVTDDLNLNLGRLRLRASGSDGGHNGLKSINQMLGGNNYARLRFGIGEPARDERQERGTADFVLRPFAPDEWPAIESAIARAADCIEVWAQRGIEAAMNEFNKDVVDNAVAGNAKTVPVPPLEK
jgi:PTH1 family peptidyl-tRNA hydrolase